MLYQVFSDSENEGELTLVSVHSKKSTAMSMAKVNAPEGWKVKYLSKDSCLDVVDFWGKSTVIVEQAEDIWV